jgi:hypothetical protein
MVFNKFNYFVQDLSQKIHNLASDQLTVALTDVAPNTSTNHFLTDLTEISYTNLSSRNLTTNSCVQTGGTLALKLANLTLTASGNVAQFRYIVIYNNTSTNDNLVCWFDFGYEVNMVSGNAITLTPNTINGLLTNQ